MRMKRYFAISVLVGCVFISGLAPASAQAEDLALLLNKISKRINSYPENNNLQYKIVKKSTEMDKQWRPKKTTVTKIFEKVVDGMLSSEVLETVEIEDGIAKNIKEEAIKQNRIRMGRKNKRSTEQKDQKSTENEFEGFIPFNEKRRAKFEFKRLNDDTINEGPVFIIETVAKEKDEDLFEGKYYIDQKTYDVLKARLKASKKPKFVKEADMDIDFQVLPEGNFMIRRFKARLDVGLLFIRIRAIIEEEYFDVKILDSKS